MARIASISKLPQIAAYFDELQAALMTGLYDPTMLAEDSTLARLEKTLADHRDHRGQTGISLLRSRPSGLAEAEGLLPHAARFFRWTASFLWSQTAPQGPFQSGDEVGCAEGTAGVGASANRFNFLHDARRVQILASRGGGPCLPPKLHIQRRIGVVATAMRGGARPGIGIRILHHPRANRVQLRVT